MYFLKTAIILSVAACGMHYWHEGRLSPTSACMQGRADASGFVYMPPLEGQKPDTVYVLVAPDRPPGDAWRAVQLAAALSDSGIPVVRTERVTFLPIGLVGLDDAGVDHISALLSGPSPIVFIDGKAKADATLQQVRAELGRDRAPLVRTAFSWR
jgi:hypothetical protein